MKLESVTPEIRRGLLFISKIFQNMSSNSQFTTMSKEQEMMIFNTLISKHLPKFKAYLEILSSVCYFVTFYQSVSS
jgi:hypothetical protein